LAGAPPRPLSWEERGGKEERIGKGRERVTERKKVRGETKKKRGKRGKTRPQLKFLATSLPICKTSIRLRHQARFMFLFFYCYRPACPESLG